MEACHTTLGGSPPGHGKSGDLIRTVSYNHASLDERWRNDYNVVMERSLKLEINRQNYFYSLALVYDKPVQVGH